MQTDTAAVWCQILGIQNRVVQTCHKGVVNSHLPILWLHAMWRALSSHYEFSVSLVSMTGEISGQRYLIILILIIFYIIPTRILMYGIYFTASKLQRFFAIFIDIYKWRSIFSIAKHRLSFHLNKISLDDKNRVKDQIIYACKTA